MQKMLKVSPLSFHRCIETVPSITVRQLQQYVCGLALPTSKPAVFQQKLIKIYIWCAITLCPAPPTLTTSVGSQAAMHWRTASVSWERVVTTTRCAGSGSFLSNPKHPLAKQTDLYRYMRASTIASYR